MDRGPLGTRSEAEVGLDARDLVDVSRILSWLRSLRRSHARARRGISLHLEAKGLTHLSPLLVWHRLLYVLLLDMLLRLQLHCFLVGVALAERRTHLSSLMLVLH